MDTPKIEQMIAYLINKDHNKQLSQVKLGVLLYFADRKCLQNCGYTLTDSTYAAMHNGVGSVEIHNWLIAGELSGSWCKISDHIERQGMAFRVYKQPGIGNTSENCRDMLDAVWEEFGNTGMDSLISHSRLLPEWYRYRVEGEDMPEVPLCSICEALGFSEERTESTLQRAREATTFTEFWNSIKKN